MEQDRITNSQGWKKNHQTTMFAIYNHFRGRNKTTEKAGFSQNTHSEEKRDLISDDEEDS